MGSVSRRIRRARRRMFGVVDCAWCGGSFATVDCLGFFFGDDEGQLSGYLCRDCQAVLGFDKAFLPLASPSAGAGRHPGETTQGGGSVKVEIAGADSEERRRYYLDGVPRSGIVGVRLVEAEGEAPPSVGGGVPPEGYTSDA